MRPAKVRRSIRRPTRAFRLPPPAALLLGLLLMGCGSGEEAIHLPEEVIGAAEAMSVDQIRADFDHLPSAKFMGRRTPSPGFDSAAA